MPWIDVKVLVDALIFSSLISFLAAGLSLTYITLKVPNFAHGDFAVVGFYTALLLNFYFGISPYCALPVCFLTAGLVALCAYKLVFKPLWKRGASVVVLMVASIGLEMIIRCSLHILADVLSSIHKTYFRDFMFRDYYFTYGEYKIPAVLFVSLGLLFSSLLLLRIFLTKTKFGIAMRAAIEDPALASTLGINVDLTYSVAWFLAGGLTGLAGVMIPFRITANPDTGWNLLLRIFAATVVGGLESVFGAAAGGFLVGFAEVVGIYILSKPPLNVPTAYRPGISFLILVVTLLVCPRGLTSIDWRRLIRREGVSKQ